MSNQPGGRHVNSPASRQYIDYGGWKLHLTVRPENYDAVDRWLDINHPGQYKLLHGGDPGEKDFTVYVGRKDDAIILTKKIMREISHLLELANAGSEDIKFTNKVAARFDPRGDKNLFKPSSTGGKPDVVYYGRNGIPYDRKGADLRMQLFYAKRQNAPQKDIEYWENIIAEHEKVLDKDLRKQYGSIYAGQYESLDRKKKTSPIRSKRKSVRKVVKKIMKKCKCGK